MSGKRSLEYGAVDVLETVRHALVIVQPLADTHHIHIAVDADAATTRFRATARGLQQMCGPADQRRQVHA